MLLDCEALLRDDPDHQAAHRADLCTLLLRLLIPPVLASHRPDNALLELERRFEAQVAELETHCHVAGAARLSLFQFTHRVEYFEGMVKARGGAMQ